jgi:hypothetical protein
MMLNVDEFLAKVVNTVNIYRFYACCLTILLAKTLRDKRKLYM